MARLGIGLDNIDVAHATARGIPVTNVPDYCLIEVAEHALALLLGLARKVAFYHHATKSGRYDLQAGPTLRRIEGQTLGIVGLGNIGRRLAEKAHGAGAESAGHQPLASRTAARALTYLHARRTAGRKRLRFAARAADARNAAHDRREQLARMKPTAYLINTARGGLIDNAAWSAALDAGQLAGAGLDVQDPEPPDLAPAALERSRA